VFHGATSDEHPATRYGGVEGFGDLAQRDWLHWALRRARARDQRGRPGNVNAGARLSFHGVDARFEATGFDEIPQLF
jgi:hypothetical protein